MPSLDVHEPGMPDLQFVLMVAALCTAELPSLNIPHPLRATIFDRCWALAHEGPPPIDPKERVLDLRGGTEVTLEALAVTIRTLLAEAGILQLTWEHPLSEPTRTSTPEAQPLIERLQQLYPTPPDVVDSPDPPPDA
ncbi:MAG: hypothetical protein ACREI9_15685 [Nitrospiraceae bacterium]